jgi:hypothetical protein
VASSVTNWTAPSGRDSLRSLWRSLGCPNRLRHEAHDCLRYVRAIRCVPIRSPWAFIIARDCVSGGPRPGYCCRRPRFCISKLPVPKGKLFALGSLHQGMTKQMLEASTSRVVGIPLVEPDARTPSLMKAIVATALGLGRGSPSSRKLVTVTVYLTPNTQGIIWTGLRAADRYRAGSAHRRQL